MSGMHPQSAITGESLQRVFWRGHVCHSQVLSCLHACYQVQDQINLSLLRRKTMEYGVFLLMPDPVQRDAESKRGYLGFPCPFTIWGIYQQSEGHWHAYPGSV
jgi:hypothetical protein